MLPVTAADTLCAKGICSLHLGTVEWMIPAGHGYAVWQVAAEEKGPEGTEDSLGHSGSHT